MSAAVRASKLNNIILLGFSSLFRISFDLALFLAVHSAILRCVERSKGKKCTVK